MGKTHSVLNNGKQQIQIKNELVAEYLEQGWVLGRLYAAWNKGLTLDDPRVRKNIEGTRQSWLNKTKDEKTAWKEKLSQSNTGKKWTSEAINKRTESRKGFIPSAEQRRKTSEKLRGHAVSQETRTKISNKNLGRVGKPCSEELKKYLSELHSSAEYQERQNETKRQNNTFNVSKPEQRACEALQSLFGDVVIQSYRDARYPYNCDIYIKDKDLFIELNLLWTHGKAPFDKNNPEHLEKLALWESKATTSKYYKNAIYTWTQLDVKKLVLAEVNKLNYLAFYTERDFYDWLNNEASRLGDEFMATFEQK